MIDFQRCTVTVDSGAVDFTAKECELLALLVQHAGEVHLARIRKKLGARGHRYIETLFGAGCRFQPIRERGAAEGARRTAWGT